MKHSLRVYAAVLAAATVAFPLNGCKTNESSEIALNSTGSVQSGAEPNSGTAENLSAEPLDISAYTNIALSNADLDTAWSAEDPVIRCAGNTISVPKGVGVSVSGQTATITKGGSYVLEGSLSDGQIIVALTDNTEKVHLICNGITIHSSSAPIWVQQADKVIVTLAEGTVNTLTDGTDYAVESDTDTAPNACLYSKDDLTMNGSGTLIVNGNCNNGIQSADDLRIVGGMLTVNAVNHGIRGSDSVVIKDGCVTVTAQGDGIKSTTTDTEGKGFVDVEGGVISVTAAQDAVDAAVALVVSGGTLTLESGGGAANAPVQSGGMHGGWGDWFTDTNITDTAVSTKGMKAGGLLAITGGTVEVDSADDALHCNGDCSVSGGEMTLAAGDDGIHSDDELYIGGNAVITVSGSYEGLEAYHISIAGGTTRVTAQDDGLNAAGGDTASLTADSMTPPDMGGSFEGGFGGGRPGGFGGFAAGSGELTITDGYLFVNAGGDGLDSNGNITMTGGTAVVCGPTNNGNGPLDSGDNNNHITLSGGTLMAVGATGMMEVPESNYIASASLNAAAGTLIVVTDAQGTVLGALQTPKNAQGIVFSAGGAAEGYTVYSGGTYDGSFNSDGWAAGGSYTPGTEICSGGGSISFTGGMGGGFGGGFGGGRPGGRP
ncbi:MAG: carbohydrate-binding domain-containing protein [Oscillospiraceae bacterium]|nr:carbohydrate-binding domain-containing protein [Oscillospiraceae bacterium]